MNQAIKLPIWIYKLHDHSSRPGGKILIESNGNIKPGMIRLGFLGGRFYPDCGIEWTNNGLVIFKGSCRIGNNSSVVVGPQGEMTIGEDFINSCALRLVCFNRIKIGDEVTIGFDSLLIDTDFHPIYDRSKKAFNKGYGPIIIGNNNWISSQCTILHNVQTPEKCIIGIRSLVTRNIRLEPSCLYGGNPLTCLKRNVELQRSKYMISDYSNE